MVDPNDGVYVGWACKNEAAGTYFSGWGPIATVYGPIVYGYEYQSGGFGPLVRPATFSLINNTCASQGNWTSVVGKY